MTPRPLCVHCGKRYGQRMLNYEQIIIPKGSATIPPYAGNQVAIARRVIKWGNDQIAISYGVWDGESWFKPYAPFCKLRCALDYARKAYAKTRAPDGSTDCVTEAMGGPHCVARCQNPRDCTGRPRLAGRRRERGG
jgi:hypothetical protein